MRRGLRVCLILLAAAVALLAGASSGQAQNCGGQPAANTVCAGPPSGGNGLPGFRVLVGADFPGLLGTVNRWTADQYFGSGRPWIDARSTANGSCPAALGNGVSNDQPALQCQVNYLNATFLGGILNIPPGNYSISSTLTIPHGVYIQCAGWVNTGIFVVGDTTAIAVGTNSTVGIHGCTIAGFQNAAATQNLITIGANSLVNASDNYMVGGNFVVQTAGTDGRWYNNTIIGWGTSGGGITSTGANWYISNRIDTSSATAAAFKQGTTAFLAENHFVMTDFSGSYTNSVLIDDGGGHNAVTSFEGSVFSSPITITSAKATMFSNAELGGTFTYNSGSLSITGSVGIASVSISGSGTSISCAGNVNIDCKGVNGIPGGLDTQVQFNNGGKFNGITGVTSNGSNLNVASGVLTLIGATSGGSILNAPATGGGTATLFQGTDTIAGIAATQTLTNKTISGSSNTLTVLAGTQLSGQVPLANGGTNANLTASNGGIFYSTSTAGAILAGTATANLPLLSGATTTPSWATISYPTSATSGGVACFTSTTVMASSVALNNQVLTMGGGAGNCPKNSGINMSGSDFTSLNATSSVASLPQFILTNSVNDANGAAFIFHKDRAGANTTTSDQLFDFQAYGYVSGPGISARIQAIQAAASSGSNIPSKWVLSTSNAAGQINQTLTFDNASHLFNAQATAPTITAGCNGAGSGVSGTDMAGTITGSTAAATTCTLTFGTAYAAAPNCVPVGLTAPLTGAVTTAAGTLVVNFPSTANFKWSYVCHGA